MCWRMGASSAHRQPVCVLVGQVSHDGLILASGAGHLALQMLYVVYSLAVSFA